MTKHTRRSSRQSNMLDVREANAIVHHQLELVSNAGRLEADDWRASRTFLTRADSRPRVRPGRLEPQLRLRICRSTLCLHRLPTLGQEAPCTERERAEHHLVPPNHCKATKEPRDTTCRQQGSTIRMHRVVVPWVAIALGSPDLVALPESRAD